MDPVAQLTSEADPRLVLGQLRAAGLLVVGHRGAGAAKALGIGSAADWLVHRPPTALAIIRTARRAQRVPVCTDGSPDALSATQALAGMPWLPGVEVTVLAVADADTRPGPARRSIKPLRCCVARAPRSSRCHARP
jgi:hypothetical protein